MAKKNKSFRFRKEVVHFIVAATAILIVFTADYFAAEQKANNSSKDVKEKYSDSNIPNKSINEQRQEGQENNGKQKEEINNDTTGNENSREKRNKYLDDESVGILNNILGGKITKRGNAEENLKEESSGRFYTDTVSFTDLFSGGGWVDEQRTTVYQDEKSTAISFPPSYEKDAYLDLSDYEKDAGLADINCNGRHVAVFFDNGKLYSFTEKGAEADNEKLSVDSSVLESELRYNEQSGVWLLSFLDKSGLKIRSFKTTPGIRMIGSAEISVSGNGLDSACVGGDCLVGVDSGFYRFSASNLSSLSRVNIFKNEDEPRGLFHLDTAGDRWLLGVVRSEAPYKGDIYTFFPEDLADGGMESSPTCRVAEESEEHLFDLQGTSEDDSCRSFQPAFTSSYPGEIRFAFNEAENRVLAVYTGYTGVGYNFELREKGLGIKPDNYSSYFRERVMQTHNLDKIFVQGESIWLSSSLGKKFPFQNELKHGFLGKNRKLLRIASGVQASLTESVSNRQAAIEAARGFEENEILLVSENDGISVDRLIDSGFEKGNNGVQWVSSKINVNMEGELVSAMIKNFSGDDREGDILFYLSSDGGKNWQEAEVGERADFEEAGMEAFDDLRWKAEFVSDGRTDTSPWISKIRLQYWLK
jgi:hypothetical protein